MQRQNRVLETARRLLPGGSLGSFVLPDDVEFVVARGRGSHIWDLDGNEYVDWLLGAGPLILGHAPSEIVSAVVAQAEAGSTFYALNEPAVQLAETLVSAVPCAEQVKFAADGTGATFFALRLARAYTGRTRVVRFEGAYHGYHDYSMIGAMYTRVPEPLPEFPTSVSDSAGVPSEITDTVLTLPYNDLELADRYIREYGDSIAAVIVEPLQRTIPPAPGFLELLRELTEATGSVLIFDEVVTGFRLAWGGAQEYYGITPDLACYGKALASGYPIGAVAGPRAIMGLANPREVPDQYAFCTGTFSGNPLSAAAANAALDVLRRPGTYARLAATGRAVRDSLARAFAEAGVPCQILGDGPIFGVAFSASPVTDFRSSSREDKDASRLFFARLIANGMLFHPKKGYACLAHTDSDVESLGRAVGSALEDVVAAKSSTIAMG